MAERERPKRGRPVGSNFFRSAARAAARVAHDHQEQQQPQLSHLSPIEYARHVLHEKREAKKQPGQPSSVFGIKGDRLNILTAYGDLHSISSIGNNEQHKLMRAMVQSRADGICCEDTELVSVHLSGDLTTMNFANLSKTTKEHNITNKVLAFGQALLDTSCFAWNVLFMMLLKMCCQQQTVDNGKRPLMTCVRLRYDETPSKVRVDDPQISIGEGTEKTEKISSSSLHAKVLQTECMVGVLIQNINTSDGTKTHTFVSGQVATPLRALHRVTGANTAAALEEVLTSLPTLRDIAGQSKFNFRHSCSDQATANMKAERILSSKFREFTDVHTLCDVHKLFRCTKSSMSAVDRDVSGLLSFAFSVGAPGSVSRLHQCLAKIFAERLVPRQRFWIFSFPHHDSKLNSFFS